MWIQTPDYVISGLDRFWFNSKVSALRALVERVQYIKQFHWILTAALVSKEYAAFSEHFDFIMDNVEIRQWYQGVLVFGFEEDKRPFAVNSRDVIIILPHALQIITQLENMGRLWEYDPLTGISQEFEDFMLLVALKEAGETVLIEIED